MTGRGSTIAVLAVAAFVALLVFVGLSQSNQNALDRSIIGTDGLSYWLDSHELETARSHRRQPYTQDDVLLRVFALYDVDLRREADVATTKEEQRGQPTQRDIYAGTLNEKLNTVETILMLPKWRAGVIELGLLDKQLRVTTLDVERVLGQIELPRLQVIHPDIAMLEEQGVVLYRPQLFDPTSVTGECKPSLSLSSGVLIAKCETAEQQALHVVSDPDFLNNHGLALGENAVVALDQLTSITRGRSGIIYFDRSADLLLSNPSTEPSEAPKRTQEDLSRFLTYPFNIILLSVSLLFLVAFWRGIIRFGPAARDLGLGHGASKSAAIDAKANLLRLVGQDAALAKEYVQQQLDDLSRLVLGKQVEQEALQSRLNVLSPTAARHLNDVVERIAATGQETPTVQIIDLTDKFELTYRRLIDELGHISRRR